MEKQTNIKLNDGISDQSTEDLTELSSELLNVNYSKLKAHQQKVTEELGPEFKLSSDLCNFSFYVFPSVICEIASSILVFNMAAFILDDYLENLENGTSVR